ncbi:hypothetical protein AAV94_11815 [Lampropedia cohaerens]|uniref:Uncharacterized protein n=1 Tax=Lampropedia cohaerens TaxID=1610491 RepID=A0A0U1PXH6_9BURK|nr:DUF58 domain-containing protein [Lampropedia cohaerens]KKW67200.1 hypothetical protein AAV94_11815 [Lampropedia cohaerens]
MAVHALRQRLDAWLRGRMPATDVWTLTQRNLYVLPTGTGWMLAVTCTLLLVASVNYQINLGFLFTFMLAGVTFVSILVAHGNLRGLTLRAQPAAPAFAHQAPVLTLHVDSGPAARKRFAVQLQVRDAADSCGQVLDLAPGEQALVELPLPPLPRGLHACPVITVQTHYPLGAFRLWSLWQPATQLLIYPAPEPNAPALPHSRSAGLAGVASTRAEAFEYDGFRAYQRGDPMRTILWKKTATALATGHGDWVRRDQAQTGATELWLDHAATGLQQPEAVLARLCAWVLQADAAGLRYGLRLPGHQLAPDAGAAHRHACLRALALQ